MMLEESGEIKENLQCVKDKLESTKEELENSHLNCLALLKDQRKEQIKRINEILYRR